MLSATQPDEVVEVFLGDTLEEAMSRAVARLGPDLTVRRARKVRKGVPGLVGKDRFEVVAVPAAHATLEAVDDAFASLLQQAEDAEDPVARGAAAERARLESEGPALHVVRPRTAREPAPTRELEEERPTKLAAPPDVLAVPEPRVSQAPVAMPVAEPVVVPPAAVAPPAPRAPRPPRAPAQRAAAKPAPVRRSSEPVGWGGVALRELGLPRSVLSRLPAKEPRTDAQWIAALTRAFEAVVPEAHAPSPTHPVVVDGHGIEGVRGILEGAARGLTPGRIHYSGRSALATPTELALAVRAEVLG